VIWEPMFVAVLVSLMVCGVLSRYRGRFALLDHPNERSLHSRSRPRSGGLGILAGLVAGFLVWLPWSTELVPALGWTVSALALVAAISFADDIWGLPAWARLPIHLLAGSLLLYGGVSALCQLDLLPGLQVQVPGWVYMSFGVLLTAWLINLYNFMDGMDGLAGGMAVIGFGTFALLGYLDHQHRFAFSAALVALTAAGFLVFNFPPARIFMGDVGSGSLGLLVASFALWADRYGIFPLWLGLMVFSPFLVDATWTLVRRALRGEKPWEAHREHFYQRLVGAGWSHRRTTLWAYVLMLKCSLFAVLGICFTASGVQGLLLGWLALTYLALIAYVNVIERKPVST
jgi:UDP-N-acetylmuramyl pentapeptide phosphotransferase/UDP-N-acetylglucosamine-1-phosphate transferase